MHLCITALLIVACSSDSHKAYKSVGGTSNKILANSMQPNFSYSILILENDGKQARDILSKNKGSEPAILSLLDCLRAPQKSGLMRKRVVRKNLSATGSRHRKRPGCSTNPKTVTPSSRVREFTDEKLIVFLQLAVPLLLKIN